MKTVSMLVTTVALFIGSAVASTDQCTGLAKILEARAHADTPRQAGLLASVKSLFEKQTPSEERCGSLRTVIAELLNGRKQGGRRLEDDRPPDPFAVQKALQDSDIRASVEKMHQEVTDPDARLVYEAAIFDAGGYNDARDARVAELRQKLK